MWWLTKDRLENIEMVRMAIREINKKYDSKYWVNKDERREYPLEYVKELESLGFMGINIPKEYGGAGYGLAEADIILEELAYSAGGTEASSSIHAVYFNNHILVKYGKEEVKQKYLPEIAKGNLRFQVFAVTEPQAGFNTTRISTIAKKEGDYYIISGQKTYISRVKYSDLGILAARTTPLEKVEKRTQGISLFLVDFREAKKYIKTVEIPNNVRRAVDTNILYIENLPIPKENLLGEEGKGLYYLLEEADIERLLIAGQSVASGKYVIKRAVEYAKSRIVFPPDPIGKYQGIQFPLADAWIRLEAADLMKWRGIELAEKNEDRKLLGQYANMAKYLAAEACDLACRYAIQTFGGYGFSIDLDIERHWRAATLTTFAQVSPHMILNFVAQHVLGLPRSYGG